jgi:adenylate cyclase
LDAKVYTAFESNRDDAVPSAAHILQEVVASSPDKLDQKFQTLQTTKQVVKEYSPNPDGDENSNLTKLLSWCWRQGTFEKIRRLSECSSMNLFFQAISQITTEIFGPAPIDQAAWKQLDRYAQSFLASL